MPAGTVLSVNKRDRLQNPETALGRIPQGKPHAERVSGLHWTNAGRPGGL